MTTTASRGIRIAVVGATGAVGRTVLRVLEERGTPVTALGAFASRQYDEPLRFRDENVFVQRASAEALRDYDVVLSAGGENVSASLLPSCLASGATVIDNSPAFRLHEGVPLVVPEINAGVIAAGQRLFPVANCTAIILTMGVWPIVRAAGLRSARVASYQAVSGAGTAGLDELRAAEAALHDGTPEPMPRTFTAPIARNVIPQVGSLDDGADSSEERKVVAETRKILGLPGLQVAVTAVRVPVATAHSEAVFLETERDTSVAELAEALAAAPGVTYHPHGIVTPRDVEGTDDVHVARLRPEAESKRHFQAWIVGDQLRKGAATNAVQILECLLARGAVRTALQPA